MRARIRTLKSSSSLKGNDRRLGSGECGTDSIGALRFFEGEEELLLDVTLPRSMSASTAGMWLTDEEKEEVVVVVVADGRSELYGGGGGMAADMSKQRRRRRRRRKVKKEWFEL